MIFVIDNMRMAVIFFYLSNDGISILENATHMCLCCNADKHALRKHNSGGVCMNQKKTKASVKTTCCYDENEKDASDILEESFALFLANEVKKSYYDTNGWLLVGGTKCTQK